MINQFFATKLTTSQTFDDQGNRVVVTSLQAGPLTVKRIKTVEKDGYSALVCGIPARKQLKELKDPKTTDFKSGDQIKISDVFQPGDLIKATGFSKGRGFAGVMKRHGFKGGPKTHGQSDRPRSPGSIGMRTTPGRVWKGKKMAGHYGNETITVKNLKVIKIEDNLLTISGTVPGSRNSLLKLLKLSKEPNGQS